MTKAIIPWVGGKRRLAKRIIPMFPEHTCYVEPFAGGAAIFFMKEQAKCEVINDANGELVNLYRVVQNHLDEFVKQFRWSLVSREMFRWALVSREMFRWAQIAVPETLTDIQRAARFFYLQKLAFGGKTVGQNFGTTATTPPRLNLLRIEDDLSAAHLRLAQVQIENLSWEKCVERYDRPDTLFYMDPPYWGTQGYGIDFPLAEYDKMASLARSMQGRVVISVNDIPEMRSAFAGLQIDREEITYTVGKGAKPTGELIIRNF